MRLALFLVPLALVACQRQAQNAAPARAPAARRAPSAQPPPDKANEYAADLNLTGTEPFWGVKIRKDKITLSRPDHPDLVAANTGAEVSGKTATWKSNELTITLKSQPGCSDGMSDRRYPYAAQVKVGDEVLKGCGYEAGEAPSPAG